MEKRKVIYFSGACLLSISIRYSYYAPATAKAIYFCLPENLCSIRKNNVACSITASELSGISSTNPEVVYFTNLGIFILKYIF